MCWCVAAACSNVRAPPPPLLLLLPPLLLRFVLACMACAPRVRPASTPMWHPSDMPARTALLSTREHTPVCGQWTARCAAYRPRHWARRPRAHTPVCAVCCPQMVRNNAKHYVAKFSFETLEVGDVDVFR